MERSGRNRTYFFYADEGLIAEYDDTGNELRSYGYQPDSMWTTDPLWLKEGGEYYWYQNNHLGTPQKLIDINGMVVWSATYTAFGNADIQLETITNHLRFPGQYEDAETGLVYNFHRYYDPGIGRYLRTDPIGFAGGDVNLYAYVWNSSINLADSLGLWGCWGGKAYKNKTPSSPNDAAAAWAQYMYEHQDTSTEWHKYCFDYNGGTYHCNTFVWDAYRKGAKIPLARIPKHPKSSSPALANDIANPNFQPELLPVVEKCDREPGDIVGWPTSSGSGHAGIVGCDGTIINAKSDGIRSYNANVGIAAISYWWDDRTPVYRRPQF